MVAVNLLRQISELAKIYALATIIPAGIALNKIFNFSADIHVLVSALGIFPFAIFGLIISYPISIIWFLWLFYCHCQAVYFQERVISGFPATNLGRLISNRLMIVFFGIVLCVPLSLSSSSLGLLVVIYVALTYLGYMFLSRMLQILSNRLSQASPNA